MRLDFLTEDAIIKTSELCFYDSNIGYSADFSKNGDVDGWTYYNNIYTYGCWNGFLFGTLAGRTGVIGRHQSFMPVSCREHYFIKITMRYTPVERIREQKLPTKAKIYWRTLAQTFWDENKSILFDIYADDKWHTYNINAGTAPYWQGDVNDLRLVVAVNDGQDGDEFFIKNISISSIDHFVCRNSSCNYFLLYKHNCPGSGARAEAHSEVHGSNSLFTFYKGDYFIININNYGDEVFTFTENIYNFSGMRLANYLTRMISEVAIGGYSECRVVFEENRFKILTGTYSHNSSIIIRDGNVTRALKFFDDRGKAIYSFYSGRLPASGFKAFSSYNIQSRDLLSLFDSSPITYLSFSPFNYNVEGGRRDWNGSLGISTYEPNDGRAPLRVCTKINSIKKTTIDFNNPINATGIIKKIYIAMSLDPSENYPPVLSPNAYFRNEGTRIYRELSNACVLIFRPKKTGKLEVIYEIPIPNRNRSTGRLYSMIQECVELDVSLYVHKGDLIGVYNVIIYSGKTFTGNEVDAQYYQIKGKPVGVFDPGPLRGQGSSGLLIYARSDEVQNRLFVEVDLQKRYNLDTVSVVGRSLNKKLEYNLCRCLDMSTFVGDTFGRTHFTTYFLMVWPGIYIIERPNVMYGINCLTDGIVNVPDGIAADNFSITGNTAGSVFVHEIFDGPGEIPVNPKYFWINGDHEWLGVYLHNLDVQFGQAMSGFSHDPFSLSLIFPYGKEKIISKCKIYFKENFNFRSWAYSVYRGDWYSSGNADDPRFDLIPKFTRVVLDGAVYEPGSPLYSQIDKYLFVNPIVGEPIVERVGSIGNIINEEQYYQARNTDWRIIEHEWEPIKAKGFRIYCSYHESTKITEIELYGSTLNVGSRMVDGVTLWFSDYGDIWWPADSVGLSDEEVEFRIGGAPRFVRIEFLPITDTVYTDVIFYVNTQDFYAGKKGCDYEYFPVEAKKGQISDVQVIELTNSYSVPYNLYVDILRDDLNTSALLFYNKLDSEYSAFNPIVGPDSFYVKEADYPLVFQNRNCAINCDCWGLQNLIQNKAAYFQDGPDLPIRSFGFLENGQLVNYSNVGEHTKSVLKIPVLSRNRYWKIVAKNPGLKVLLNELRLFKDGAPVEADFYYEMEEPRYVNLCQTMSGIFGGSGGNPSRAFDDDLTTYWESGGGWSWLSFTFSSEVVVKGLRFIIPSSSSVACPSVVVFQASVSGTFDMTDAIDLGVFNNSASTRYGGYMRLACPYLEHDSITNNVNFLYELPNNIDAYKYYRVLFFGLEYGVRIAELCLLGDTFYNDFYTKPLIYPAPHLKNASIRGSNYLIFKNNCVGFDLGTQGEIDTMVFFHQTLLDVERQVKSIALDSRIISVTADDYTGIDASVVLHLYGEGNPNDFIIRDASYHSFPLVLGSGVKKADDFETLLLSSSFSESFADCYNLQDWFSNNYSLFSCLSSGSESYLRFDFSTTTDGYYGKVLLQEQGMSHTSFCIDETTKFKVRFKVSFDNFYMGVQGGGFSGRVGVGLIGDQVFARYGGGMYLCFETSQYEYNRGISLVFTDRFYFSNYSSVEYVHVVVPTSSGVLFVDTPYYVELSSDGKFTYSARIWDDGWDGNNLIGAVSVKHYHTLFATSIGVTGFYYPNFNNRNRGNYSGKLWEVHADLIERTIPKKNLSGSIEFSGNPITAPNNHGAMTKSKNILCDFYILFYELPRSGTYIDIFRVIDGSLRLTIQNVGGEFRLKVFYGASASNSVTFPISSYKWHHLLFTTYTQGSYIYYYIGCDGMFKDASSSPLSMGVGSYYDIEIGKHFKGLLSNFRFISDFLDRVDKGIHFSNSSAYPIPLKPYKNKYSFTIYTSADNVSFGKYADVDLFGQCANVYYSDMSEFSTFYNSCFYVDLGQRHRLDIIRNYGASSALQISKNKFISYSNSDVDSVVDADFTYTDKISDDFSEGLKPNLFLWDYTDNADLYLENNKLRLNLHGTARPRQELKANYLLVGDFDIQMEYQLVTCPSAGDWSVGLFVEDTVTSGCIGVQRRYISSYQHIYAAVVQPNDIIYHRVISDTSGILRLKRRGATVTALFKRQEFWDVLYKWVNWSFNDVMVVLRALSTVVHSIYIDNFYARKFLTTRKDGYMDARWLKINLVNGDTTPRMLYKLGIYPDISCNVSPGGNNYNTYWDYLGTSITNYTEGVNVALTATVSGSSFFPGMEYFKIIDGFLGETLDACWGSAAERNPWVVVDLGDIRSIYRVRIYHGFSSTNTDILAQDYMVQISEDGTNFITIFNVSGNEGLVRVHDLMTPINARYVRIFITRYKTSPITLRAGDSYSIFKGVCLREVEVYSYYGYQIINSEQYPIIAIDLKKQFFLGTDHELVGVNAESTITDWTSVSGAFAYSDTQFSDPKKISFRSFGSGPYYDRWVAIKQNTATYYGDGPDYLKHAIIKMNEAPNPCDYYWWWSSNVSSISRGHLLDTQFATSSLKIEYPASNRIDTVLLRPGGSFGVDSLLSWRDGFSFRLYIDQLNNLDLEQGYFFIRGVDGTSQHEPLEYRWFFSTLSGVGAFVGDGWNQFFLSFKIADQVLFGSKGIEFKGENPLELDKAEFNCIGFSFRGKNHPITMYFDGAAILRNHFESYSRFGQGLYLVGNDFFTAPIGSINLNAGTIEFWLRPDYNFSGADYLGRFKIRTLFHFGNPSGDVFGAMIGSDGLSIYYGQRDDLRAFVVDKLPVVVADLLLHIGIVFSANGLGTGDGTTIKVFLNNNLVAQCFEKWHIYDNKFFRFTLGGQGMLGAKERYINFVCSSIDGVVSELKIYNYCKRDFHTSMIRLSDDERGDWPLKASNFIEISKNNLTFFKVGDPELPFVFEQVPPGDKVFIYYRLNLPKNIQGVERRTGGIVASWEIGV